MGAQLILMEGIDKSFPGVRALNQCHFDVNRGEVHALVGENGAGKSTLMKILAGIYQRDGGKIFYEGREVNFTSPKEALDAGIGIIHQELNLMPHLTVAENIFIGKEFTKGIFIDQNAINQEAEKLLKSLNLDIDPRARVMALSVAKQQMVEIAKALSYDSQLIIMDEPTSSLTDSEIEELFRFIRDLKARNRAVVYISHRMDEVFAISDRITVMRDGEYVGTFKTEETDRDTIIKAMVGRTIYIQPKEKSMVEEDAPVVLEVRNLKSDVVKDVSFKLRKGEILGFAGLVGAGRTETARLIFGADPKQDGEIFIRGKKVEINSPQDAVANGIGYLSEDRRRFGLAVGLPVDVNVTMASLENYINKGIIDFKKERETASEYVKKLSIRTPSIRQLVRNLSGGNQQKIVVAKWLVKNCDILIFDEPTRGIDVGAKSEIYKLMDELTKEGKSIIMISSELPELLRMSDRIIVMCEGVKTAELNIEEATQEIIMKYATSHK